MLSQWWKRPSIMIPNKHCACQLHPLLPWQHQSNGGGTRGWDVCEDACVTACRDGCHWTMLVCIVWRRWDDNHVCFTCFGQVPWASPTNHQQKSFPMAKTMVHEILILNSSCGPVASSGSGCSEQSEAKMFYTALVSSHRVWRHRLGGICQPLYPTSQLGLRHGMVGGSRYPARCGREQYHMSDNQNNVFRCTSVFYKPSSLNWICSVTELGPVLFKSFKLISV